MATPPPPALPHPPPHPPAHPSPSTPATPPMPASTPNLSSPGTPLADTPVAHLRTPAARFPGPRPVIRKASAEPDSDADAGAGGGLGGLGAGAAGRKMRAALGVPPRDAASEDEEDEEDEVDEADTPSPAPAEAEESMEDDEIHGLRASMALLGDGEAVALLRRVAPTVEQVPFLREQITTQQATIAAMQEQARVLAEMARLEQEQHAAERAKWAAERRALARVRDAELAGGTRPRKTLDVDVGYHQELEARNKELSMKNQLMAPRLQDAQMQIERLVHELRHLRAHVILETHPFNAPDDAAPPRTPAEGAAPRVKRKEASMGDARAEHLILAARKVRSMREKDGDVGHLTLGELQRAGVVGADGSAAYGARFVHDDDDDELESEEGTPVDRSGKKKAAQQTTPLLPRARKSSNRKLPAPPTTPSRSRAPLQAPVTTPGGNFNDLVRAAELAGRPALPGTPSGRARMPAATMSATRSTTFARADHILRAGSESPSKRPRLAAPPPLPPAAWRSRDTTPPPSSQGTSALDILASASQLDHVLDAPAAEAGPSGAGGAGTLASAARFEGMLGDARAREVVSPTHSAGEGLAPAIDLTRRTDGAAATPRRGLASAAAAVDPDDPFIDAMPRLVSVKDEDGGAFHSPTGAAVPGLGRYVGVLGGEPAKRVRSPYSKWTVEEDELLARAVAQHGEKWDQVSKCVPTRSYHQVRQRWLRKTGAFDKKQAAAASAALGPGALEPSPLAKAFVDAHGSPTPGKRKA